MICQMSACNWLMLVDILTVYLRCRKHVYLCTRNWIDQFFNSHFASPLFSSSWLARWYWLRFEWRFDQQFIFEQVSCQSTIDLHNTFVFQLSAIDRLGSYIRCFFSNWSRFSDSFLSLSSALTVLKQEIPSPSSREQIKKSSKANHQSHNKVRTLKGKQSRLENVETKYFQLF